jgi:polyisoprenoid-binding protein YceI
MHSSCHTAGSVILLLLVASSLLFEAAITQAAQTIDLDAAGSSVKFVGDSFLHSFHGEAKDITGSAELDGATVPPVQKATLHFKTAALTTFHKERDQKMFAWLGIALHPDAHFSLQSVKPVEGDYQNADAQHPARFAIRGSFTLNGVKEPMAGFALGWRDKDRLIISGETIVDTLKHGLPQIREAFLTVGTDIKVTYRFSFILPRDYAVK